MDSHPDGARARSKINYYGFSYGTYLGQVYATLYPSRVRRMVLDSNVDPRDVWYHANLDQDIAFELQHQGLVRAGWRSTTATTSSAPPPTRCGSSSTRSRRRCASTRPAGVIGPDEWDDAFLLRRLRAVDVADLATAFADWVHHRDATQLIAA